MRHKRNVSHRTGSTGARLPAELFSRELYVAIYESLGEGIVLEKDAHDGYLYRGRFAGRIILKYDRPEHHFCIELNRPIRIVNGGKHRIDIAYVLATPRFEEQIEELSENRRLFASFSYLPGIHFMKRDPGNVTSIDMRGVENTLRWIGIGELSLDRPARDYTEVPWGMTR